MYLFTQRRTADDDLAGRLGAVALDAHRNQCDDEDDPEDVLLAHLATAFTNLSSLDASFRPTRSNSAPNLPQYSTISRLYELIRLRPAVLEVLRDQVDAILRRPGPTLAEGDGGWVVALMECPIFLADFTVEAETRRSLQSRFIGLLCNLPNFIHHSLVTYLSSPTYPRLALLEKVELLCSFISFRIGRCIDEDEPEAYADDWMVRAGARVASLLFAANLNNRSLPLSAFYVTLVDSLGESILITDFQAWENCKSRFSLCQYPFLLSLGVKMMLLAFDGERQMIERTREAYRNNLSSEELENPLLVLRVRRDRLVDDSLRQISLYRADLKKPLRITWEGEEGIDAGSYRLQASCHAVAHRQNQAVYFGMFLHDPDSNLCWFNPAAKGMEDDFWMVGVVVGLAVYNEATLDIPLPLAAYKKLASESLNLRDLAQVQPALARGLQQLLDYDEGDIEGTFLRTFVGTYEAWGEVVEVELVEGGEQLAVTERNRQDYVDRLVEFILSTSVSSQWEAFAEGFNEVCAGNALSLFKAQELELVVRGSPEPLDVEALKGVTVYEGFSPEEPTIQYLWSVFASLPSDRQRRLLAFCTASDRIPATGVSALQLRLQCLGDDCDRLPQSHTCFNTLSMWRYGTREKVERMLVRAMEDSEGFGLR
ncbi:E3 ubiquitin-protein ligase HECTD2 [Rhodotorula toruloides]|uniref:HECT-type E3 ubiquitin transferase n=1 Tax=Rhodotorula toruloides TaxID=5286 RepID=A0A511K6Y5_RHOTO|nr:E3 ubiquitin-protein ligase HECTD2 [Rhodotorula toruloides]